MVTKGLTPKGGWHFKEGELIIRDETFDQLVLAVVAHRINNGKPMGHPAQEIEQQIEERKNEHVS